MKPEITETKNNIEKSETYRALKGRCKKAIQQGFYLEGILIDYALIEDRLASMLYYMAIIRERTSTKASDVSKKYLKPAIYQNETDCSIRVKDISGKINVIKKSLDWVSTNTSDLTKERYLCTLKNQCEGMDIGFVLETLDKIEKWKDYRNEVIHGLMNKNIQALDGSIPEKVTEGLRLSEEIDSQVKILKKNNRIRKAARMK